MRFAIPQHYAIEFSLRSLLNYYYFRRTTLSAQNNDEEIKNLTEKITSLKNQLSQMAHNNGYEHNFTDDYCEGTMLINSMLGMLVLPQQELYKDIEKYQKDDDLERYLKVLYGCLCNGNYENTYRDKNGFLERVTPANILRHIKNAFSHNRVCLHPTTNDNESLEVTHIDISDQAYVYEDLEKNNYVYRSNLDQNRRFHNTREISVFNLSIPKESFDDFVLELQQYILEIDRRRNE